MHTHAHTHECERAHTSCWRNTRKIKSRILSQPRAPLRGAGSLPSRRRRPRQGSAGTRPRTQPAPRSRSAGTRVGREPGPAGASAATPRPALLCGPFDVSPLTGPALSLGSGDRQWPATDKGPSNPCALHPLPRWPPSRPPLLLPPPRPARRVSPPPRRARQPRASLAARRPALGSGQARRGSLGLRPLHTARSLRAHPRIKIANARSGRNPPSRPARGSPVTRPARGVGASVSKGTRWRLLPAHVTRRAGPPPPRWAERECARLLHALGGAPHPSRAPICDSALAGCSREVTRSRRGSRRPDPPERLERRPLTSLHFARLINPPRASPRDCGPRPVPAQRPLDGPRSRGGGAAPSLEPDTGHTARHRPSAVPGLLPPTPKHACGWEPDHQRAHFKGQ